MVGESIEVILEALKLANTAAEAKLRDQATKAEERAKLMDALGKAYERSLKAHIDFQEKHASP